LLESCKELAGGGRSLREECRKSVKGAENEVAGGLIEMIVDAKDFWQVRERT